MSRMKRRDFIGFLTLATSGLANTRLFSLARRKQGKEKSEDGEVVKGSMEPAGKGRRWVFDTWGNQKGWTVPTTLTGAVMGGGLWLTLTRKISDVEKIEQIKYQIYGDSAFINPNPPSLIASPQGLNITASQVQKVRLRLLNLSPETDGYVYWRTKASGNQEGGPVRFTMHPDLKQWQNVVCHVDSRWSGTIDQIKLRVGTAPVRGDIWIERIEITGGAPPPQAPRPDVSSAKVVPKIGLPGISQEDFHDAFKVLDECLITQVPVFGFNFPVMGPGGSYGEDWWQLDSSLAVAGAKWANQEFAENVMRGFRGVQTQNPDGRIDLYGTSVTRGQIGDSSSLPRFFEAAYDVARRTAEKKLREEIYLSMSKYLAWWLSPVKQDRTTKLITGVFEETLSEICQTPQTLAPVDLNVGVALGCYRTSTLAAHLGKETEAKQYRTAFRELKQAINCCLWDETKGAYYNYDVKEAKRHPALLCTTFDPLRLGIALAPHVKQLIPKLLDSRLFNWGNLPVTTIAKTDPHFMEATGAYNGAQWFGDVWALRNLFIVSALEDVGRHELAAELAWVTIKAFNANYHEYLIPSTGKGGGVERYAWSASLYITAIIENLFGVDYDRLEQRLRIVPHVPQHLFGKEISLSELIIPAGRPSGGDARLSVRVRQAQGGEAEVSVTIRGVLPKGRMEIGLPNHGTTPTHVTDEKGSQLAMVKNPEGLVNVTGVQLPIRSSAKLQFE